MEKFPESGTPLLPTGITSTEVTGVLREVGRHPALVHLHRVLRKDALLFLVGGSVRDTLLNKPLKDIDLATVLRPEEVIKRLESAGTRVVETGISHGTVLAVWNTHHVEITTFRRPGTREEAAYSDSISTDLEGRDFTVNAMAFDLNENKFLDPYAGLEDLNTTTIRAVGEPLTRFREDPLRILRMLRFGPASGWNVENETIKAAAKITPEVLTVSIERIQQELCKILCCSEAGSALRMARDLQLLSFILPEMTDAIGCEQNEFHIEDVFEHTLSVIDRAPLELEVRLAALFHDLGKPATVSTDSEGRRHFYRHEQIGKELCQQAMKRLRFSRELTSAVSKLVALHMRPLECGPSGVRRIIRDTGEHFDAWLKLKRADKTPVLSEEEFEERFESFCQLLNEEYNRRKDPVYGKMTINGDTLKKLGIPEGPVIGKILRVLDEELMEDPERNSPEYLIERSKNIYKEIG